MVMRISNRLFNSEHFPKFDVCIVGGGIVGTALAVSIAQSKIAKGLKIGLIEAGNLFCNHDVIDGVFSNRVSSFTPTSVEFLEKLRVWKEIPLSRKHAYTNMQVWDSVSYGKIEFTRENGVASITENRLIQGALAKYASTFDNITILNSTKVSSIKLIDSIPVLNLENGETISAELLVGADGANSKVRQFSGIDTVGYKYNQKGLVCTVSLNANENNSAWQRFLPTGPVALLPVFVYLRRSRPLTHQ